MSKHEPLNRRPEEGRSARWTRLAVAAVLLGLTGIRVWDVGPDLIGFVTGDAGIGAYIDYCGTPPVVQFASLVGGMLEPVLGVLLMIRRDRHAAIVGTLWMAAVAIGNVVAGAVGWDLRGCNCFGAFDAPWWVHSLVGAAIAAGCAFVWRCAPRPAPALSTNPVAP